MIIFLFFTIKSRMENINGNPPTDEVKETELYKIKQGYMPPLAKVVSFYAEVWFWASNSEWPNNIRIDKRNQFQEQEESQFGSPFSERFQ